MPKGGAGKPHETAMEVPQVSTKGQVGEMDERDRGLAPDGWMLARVSALEALVANLRQIVQEQYDRVEKLSAETKDWRLKYRETYAQLRDLEYGIGDEGGKRNGA